MNLINLQLANNIGTSQALQINLAQDSSDMSDEYKSGIFKLSELCTAFYRSGYSSGREEIVQFGKIALTSSEFEYGQILVPFLNDFLLKNDWSNDVVEPFLPVLSRLVEYINQEALEVVGKRTLLALIRQGDWLENRLIRNYYRSFPNGAYGVWSKRYVPVIKQNQELLGSEQIKIAGREVAQTVQHWLEDYVGFVGKTDGKREALDRLNFINQSPNVKLLSAEERNLLLKLLEIFDWFCDPYVTKEVVEYFEGPISTKGVGPVADNTEEDAEAAERDADEDLQETSPVQEERLMVEGLNSTPLTQVQTPQKPRTVEQPVSNVPKGVREELAPKLSTQPHEELLLGPHGLLESGEGLEKDKELPTPPAVSFAKDEVENNEQFEMERKQKGVQLPKLSKPIDFLSRPEKGKKVAVPKVLDLEEIKAQAQKQKQKVERNIDERLHDLSDET